MRQVVLSQTGAGQSAPIILDQYIKDFQVTVSCVVTGTVAYSLQYTYDNVFNVASPTWWTDSDIIVGTAGNAETTFDNPVFALRINQASGTGTVTATVT